jgi:hypothetical protein
VLIYRIFNACVLIDLMLGYLGYLVLQAQDSA